jgi:hypothetical protein
MNDSERDLGERHARRGYEPPRLIVIGSVAELTQAPHGKIKKELDALCSVTGS